MSTELIINATLPETRIALLENGEIQELHIERDSERGIVGNIYKGKVIRVLPGMQAAFVDIGLEKAAFLYVDDIFFPEMKTPLSTNALPDPKTIISIKPGPRVGKNERFVKPGNRPRQPQGRVPLPGTPEAHDMLQREYAKQMLDIDVDGNEIGTSEKEYLNKMADEKTEALGLPSEANPEDYVASGAEEQPVARSPEPEVLETAGTEITETEVTEIDSEVDTQESTQESSQEDSDDIDGDENLSPDLISRSEPQIDPDAWVEDVVQAPQAVEPMEMPTEDLPDLDESSDKNEDSDESEMPRRRKRREQVNIADLVREGQEILVQVAKDPIGTKGARLTCHVSLPGRYLVFMPTVDHIGVSRRIESESDRRRLKDTISKIRPSKTGVIVRTASGNQTDQNLKSDLDYLVETWNEVQKKFNKQKTPSPVYQDLTIVLRAIRDMFTDEVDKVIVDSKREHKAIMKFVTRFIPQVKNKVELFVGTMPIFDFYGIETEISKAMDRKVWLKSGGYLVVDQAEALVAIDVNTGRYVGKKTLEETILKTNLEAVKEIAYQLRLRNCGGIIILDLIDMDKEASREKVYKALEEALKKDRARPTIMKISQLGLIEMTRKRTRDSIVRSMCEPCSYCEGRGFVRNKLTIAFDIMRDVEREIQASDLQGISIQCHPSVADILLEDKRDVMEDLERQYSKRITVRSNGAYHAEQYELVVQLTEKNITWSSEERKQLVRQRIHEHMQKNAQENRKKNDSEKGDRKKEHAEKKKNAADQRRKSQDERRRQGQQQKFNKPNQQRQPQQNRPNRQEQQQQQLQSQQDVQQQDDLPIEGAQNPDQSEGAQVSAPERTKIVINKEALPQRSVAPIVIQKNNTPIDPDQIGNRGGAPRIGSNQAPIDEDEDGPQPLVDPTGRPLNGNQRNIGYYNPYASDQGLTIHSIQQRPTGGRPGGQGGRPGGQGGGPGGPRRPNNNNNRNRNKPNRFGGGGGQQQGGRPRFQQNAMGGEGGDPQGQGPQNPRNNRNRHHRGNRNRFRKGPGGSGGAGGGQGRGPTNTGSDNSGGSNSGSGENTGGGNGGGESSSQD